ncbi:low-density lipoprotein receptor-related protein 5-like [Lytechinus variegatus]|uniref:low-density lipoprotein receptor-related protein 5-like n=1 Tax=Lytechinus variegatus TaxID=7654 RepID=UPI001BB2695E|nr:low-density lipoprotein receptor-related protein 5-like [Lytechinus variegatus]
MRNVSQADKIFVTDVIHGKVFVGENTGPYFYGQDIEEIDLTSVEAPVGIDYDYQTNRIYWTDEETKRISRAFIDGSGQEIIVNENQGIGIPQGIVLDLAASRFYWTDTLLERITSASLDGSNRRTIISSDLYLPWSITLSQKRGKLYWCDEGQTTGKIEMSNKDGSDRRKLITASLTQPYGLALDSQEQRLYWTEGFYDVIESIDLDDLSDRRDHVYAERGDLTLFGISLYFNSIYFTDFSSQGLHASEIGVEDIREVTGFTQGSPTHVKIYADLTCDTSCIGNSRCQLIAYDTPECVCIVGWEGFNCFTRVTCILPDPPSMASFVNPSDSYSSSTTVTVVCDNGNDQVEWICNGYTGNFDREPIDCSSPAAVVFFACKTANDTACIVIVLGPSIALIGGIIGGVVVLVLICVIVYCAVRKPQRTPAAPAQTPAGPTLVYTVRAQQQVITAERPAVNEISNINQVNPVNMMNPSGSSVATSGMEDKKQTEHEYMSTMDMRAPMPPPYTSNWQCGAE